MVQEGSGRWRRGKAVMAASAILLSSCGLSFVPPSPTVQTRCINTNSWAAGLAANAPRGIVCPPLLSPISSSGRTASSRWWSSRRDVDVDKGKGELLRSLRSSNNVDEVNEAVEKLEKVGAMTLKDYTTVFTALKRIKNWQHWKSWAASDHVAWSQTPITYNVVMGACGAAGRWKEALQLFYDMQGAGFPPDSVTIGSLMNAFVRAGLWARALDVMATSKEKGISLTEGSYTAGLMACEKGGQWALALELLKEMHLVGINPSNFAYNAAIFSCRRDKQWVQAIALLGEMRQDGRSPDRNSYHGAMASCEEAEKWEAVMDLFEELKQLGIDPSRQSYEYVTRACKEYMYLTGVDEKLKDYLRRNNISPNVVENDDREVLLLEGPQLLEQLEQPDDLDDQPTWLSFADDDDE